AYLAAQAALEGWDPSFGALYYYNPETATSEWVFYRDVIIKIGEHYFALAV
ncbi:MAG: cell wall hydrolase, partial [Candidatus Lokiarchaeota archaeon]|nr:cell wall hydrolase [Candidatus Lokiarchaeota archaeon]